VVHKLQQRGLLTDVDLQPAAPPSPLSPQEEDGAATHTPFDAPQALRDQIHEKTLHKHKI
jgi:hypothetical protein